MKPSWLNKKVSLQACSRLQGLLRASAVETVCEQALCPNIGECFEKRQATFLILGRQCTRACTFCNIEKGRPGPPDWREPERVAAAVEKLGLSHAVITSVTRDDLADGGASLFRETVLRIRRKTPEVTVEVLIPDFGLSLEAIAAVATSGPDIVAHNLETVASLYPLVRPDADYGRSLEVLRSVKRVCPAVRTKSGAMVGMGEKHEEVLRLLADARGAGCDFFSIGQYLAPSGRHYPVREFVMPEAFERYKEEGGRLGFAHVESGPYVRSSYMAHRYLGGVA